MIYIIKYLNNKFFIMVKYFNITYFSSDERINKICFSSNDLLHFNDDSNYLLKRLTNKNYYSFNNGYSNVLNDNCYDEDKFLSAPFIELVYYVLKHSIIKDEKNKFYLDVKMKNSV